jgi:methanogenic corrinoid protein MtbC1
MGCADSVATLYQLILLAQREEAGALLAKTVADTGYSATLRDLLEPAMFMIGDRWAAEGLSLAQGFVAGKIAEDFLALGKDYWLWDDQSSGGDCGIPKVAVMGNVEDDYHVLGRSMVVSFLRIKGWKVLDLGCDVQAAAFVDHALKAGACVIGASAMMLTTAKNIRSIREVLDRRGLAGRIKLAVGGAVFRMRPELVAELGGEGTAHNALDAPALFERLHDEVCALVGNPAADRDPADGNPVASNPAARNPVASNPAEDRPE